MNHYSEIQFYIRTRSNGTVLNEIQAQEFDRLALVCVFRFPTVNRKIDTNKVCTLKDKFDWKIYVDCENKMLIEFFTIGKPVRSDRNKKQFLRIITI